MKKKLNLKLNTINAIIKKISFSITLIIMATILCSGVLMHILIN